MLVKLSAGYVRTDDIQRFIGPSGLSSVGVATYRTGAIETFNLADAQAIRKALDAEIRQQADVAENTRSAD